jgi:resuscitation-promoting factor RpfB
MTRLLAAAVTVALLTPTPAHARLHRDDPAPPPPAKPPTHVTVQPGDTLAELADDWPGGWTRAAHINQLDNPDLITVGDRLRIPRRDGPRWTPPRPTPATSRTTATTTTSVTAAAPAAPTSTGGLNWAALARCESGGNPRAVSPSGRYRGAFQFDLATWRSVGMTGDPIAYPYSVQLTAAQRLYASRGRSPWPHCGRLL